MLKLPVMMRTLEMSTLVFLRYFKADCKVLQSIPHEYSMDLGKR